MVGTFEVFYQVPLKFMNCWSFYTYIYIIYIYIIYHILYICNIYNILIYKYINIYLYFFNIKRENNSKIQKCVPLVVACHSLLKSLSSIVNNSIYLLHMNQEVKKTFNPQSMVSYQNASKLCRYLVRTKLYPIERKIGSCKCISNWCEVCKNVLEADTFICSNDQTT